MVNLFFPIFYFFFLNSNFAVALKVPSEAPHLFGWNADWAENGISFWINPIEERYHGGRLLGYQITYFQFGKEDKKIVIQVDPNQQRASLSNLTEGMTYHVFASGFTSKGVGANRTYAITCKSISRLYSANGRYKTKKTGQNRNDFCSLLILTSRLLKPHSGSRSDSLR